jgi:hypothetical protein
MGEILDWRLLPQGQTDHNGVAYPTNRLIIVYRPIETMNIPWPGPKAHQVWKIKEVNRDTLDEIERINEINRVQQPVHMPAAAARKRVATRQQVLLKIQDLTRQSEEVRKQIVLLKDTLEKGLHTIMEKLVCCPRADMLPTTFLSSFSQS